MAEARSVAVPAELRADQLAERLRSLVATPSVNPSDGEAAMVEQVAGHLSQLDLQLHRIESIPGRPSLAAVLAGRSSGPRLVLNGHTDTVATGDPAAWTAGNPLGGAVRDGRLYGRGACDMKAGLAVAIAVAEHLAARRDLLHGTLILHFAAGEETAERGTASLLEAGFGGDLGIVLEPTELRVATASRGLAAFRATLHGAGGHAGQPDATANPISSLPALLTALAEHDTNVRRAAHPLLPSPRCTPTVVRAGEARNAIPATAELVVDRRLLPGDRFDATEAALRAHLETRVALPAGLQLDLERLPGAFEPSEIACGSQLAQRLRAIAAERAGVPSAPWGTPYASDVRVLVNQGGMEAVTFGPGRVEDCHRPDERIALAEVERAAVCVAQLARELLTDEPGQ